MEQRPFILIVEDDDEIRDLVCAYLRGQRFDALGVVDAVSMDQALASHNVDLIVLDIMLPGDEDGLAICRRLRASRDIPIIMLTAMNDEIDKIIGIELGADDYMTKPFNPRELTARINAVLRRSAGPKAERHETRGVRCAHLIVDYDRREVRTSEGSDLGLSGGEYSLLTIFLSRPQRVLDRDQLMDLLNGRAFNAAFDRSIDVQVSRLRKKIEADPTQPVLIKTVRNGGYILAEKVVPL